MIKKKLRILIVDDHPVVRNGIKQILAETPDIRIGGELSSGKEVLAKVRDQHWDVLLLDIAMPGMSGLEVLRELKNERHKLPVLVLSLHPEDQYALQAIKAGAAGYLNKDSAATELISAIRRVATGGRYVSNALAEKLAFELVDHSEKSSLEKLWSRDSEEPLIQKGRITIRPAERLILFDEKPVETLTPKEYALLKELVSSSPRVVPKERLVLKVWQRSWDQMNRRSVDVHIQRLRHKLGPIASAFLKTITLIGYQWLEVKKP